MAKNNDIKIIITSSLESNVGLTACMHLVSAFNIKEPCGLSTVNIFENNFGFPIDIINGEIQIPGTSGLGINSIDAN